MKIITTLLDFFSDFSERGKLFIIVFFSSIIAVSLSLLIGGWLATSVVIIPAIFGVLQVTKGIWTPEGGGKSKIGLISLGIAFAAILSNQLWKPVLDSLLEPLYSEIPFLKDKLPTEAPSIFALLFLATVILIVNYFARDTTAMKEHSTPLEKEFPEKDYKKLLDSFSGVLLDDLNKIDRETNWSAEIFTPLDAEVEIKTGSKRLKKVTDLLTAIRSDRKSRVFLVLGDPGSGKSVALRKLCRDLLKEVKRTGKVPLYINLREWETKEIWSEKNPPTVEELYDFVLNNLKSRGDVFTNEFLDKYFKKMFEDGRLFIVLDSFDEIPSVMDVDEKSWLIDSLSDIIHKFLGGAHESRGILASRIFRRPTDKFDAKTIFEIRPFTENKIVESLEKSLSYDESLTTLLFNERQELIPVARNPFTAALISSYAKDHNNTLPQNQSELYSSYISLRLDSCEGKMAKKNLNKEKVMAGAIEIADVMLTNQTFGLEASISDLKENIPNKSIEDIIDILRFARLGRLGGGDEKRFSFVHRRFNEYFVVQRLIELPSRVPQDAIPTDSRWRDALVLYCEVASEEEARKIAEFCWSEVSKLTEGDLDLRDPQYLRSIHCLRFLKEAFRARLDCIESFRNELADFILNQIENDDNLLSLKLAVEAVGLLDEEDIDSALIKALKINNQWINEISLKSCHYLPSLSEELNKRLMFSIENINSVRFFKSRREILFSLKLSNVFSSLRKYCIWRIVDFYILLWVFVAFSVLFPIPSLMLLIEGGFTIYLFNRILVSKVVYARNIINRFFIILASSPILILYTTIFLHKDSVLPSKAASDFYFAPLKNIFAISDYFYAAITILLIIVLLPWFHFFYFIFPSILKIKDWIREIKVANVFNYLATIKIAELFKQLVTMLIFLLVVAGVVWGMFRLIPGNEPIMFSLAAVVVIPFLLYSLIKFIATWWYDFRNLRVIQKKLVSSREQISKQFSQFKTKEGRHKYVQYLQNEGIKPTGIWLEGKIPNHKNDEASTLLAQLEEKWLGLDK
jgi:hypothetical protein